MTTLHNMAQATDFEGEIEQNPLFANGKSGTDLSIWKDWIRQKRAHLKPWGEFLNVNAFSKPKDFSEAGRRIVRNIETYQTNYVVISLFLVLYCIITSPLLLLAFSVFLGACFFISRKSITAKVKILGRELSVAEQYAGALLISLPIFFLASAGSAVFWIIGASVFTITLHASLSRAANEEEQIELDEIKSIS